MEEQAERVGAQGDRGALRGWWPSLAAFVAERMSGTKSTPPAELLGVLEEVGRSWIAEERFSLLEDDGGEGGVFVIRGGWW